MGVLWRSRMNETEIDDAYVNGFNNAIDELMTIVQAWYELDTADFTRDTKNNAWVNLLSLAKISDELKW
tara:strand:+ start:661 stop:867 length:207 start_codon:yes stop_codon:yes gene_type:complete